MINELKIGLSVFIAARKATGRGGHYLLACYDNTSSEYLKSYIERIPCKIVYIYPGVNSIGACIIEPDESKHKTGAWDADVNHVTRFGLTLGRRYWSTYAASLFPLTASLSNGTHSSIPISCRECFNGCPYAEPNCTDNTFVCWSCKKYKPWKFESLLIK